jgi:hypothetical protein
MRMTSVLLLLGFTWPALASAAQLRLTWEDTTPSEAGFLIERRMATEESFTPLTTVVMNITSYVDSTVEAATTYCYQVRAFDAEEDSAPSNEACSQAQ